MTGSEGGQDRSFGASPGGSAPRRAGTGTESLDERRSQALATHQTGAFAEAERLYRSILESAPGDGETWHRLAVLYGQQGRPAEVVECCLEALRNGFRSASVYANLGLAQRELGQRLAARAAFGQALDIDPADADLMLEHFSLLLEDGEEREALYCIGAACARFPSDDRMHTEMGRLAISLNDGQLAEESFRHAARLRPDSAESWLNLGSILFMRGDTEGSEYAYREALKLEPDRPHTFWYLGQCPGAREDLELSGRVLERAAVNHTPASAPLHFCAGRIHDGAGRTAEAFDAWATGNRLVRGTYRYSVAEAIDALGQLDRSMHQRLVGGADARWPSGEAAPTPVFIVGMPRSGSTLIEQLLARHPEIDAGGEIVWLQRQVRQASRAAGLRYPSDQLLLDEMQLAGVLHDYGRAIALRARQGRFITDKLPGNFACIPSIRRLFPEALILHARRDALETCWSCFRHLFSSRQSFAYDLTEVGRYCVAAHQFIDRCAALWPEHVIEVRYETLVENPTACLEPVLRWLGLEWFPGCLDTAGSPELIQTASSLQVRAGIAAVPMVSARRYHRHLDALRDAL